MQPRKIFGFNMKNALNFSHFLETRGVYDYLTLNNNKLTSLFLEFQEEFCNSQSAKNTPYNLSAAEMNEPFSLVALATAAEYADTHREKEALLGLAKATSLALDGVGDALTRASKNGANIYRAVSLSVRSKDLFDMEAELAEDNAIKRELAEIFHSGRSEHRLEEALKESPYEKMFGGFEEIIKKRAILNKILASHKATAKDLEHAEALKEELDHLQDQIKNEMKNYNPQTLKEVVDCKQIMLTDKQTYAQGVTYDDPARKSFPIEETVAVQATMLFEDYANELYHHQTMNAQTSQSPTTTIKTYNHH